MPLVRIALRKGKPAAYKTALMGEIYQAMREVFEVPEEDRFVVISEHDEDTFCFSDSYLGIARSNELVIIQITANNTRTVEKKKALFARIADRLAASPGVRREDVFINLIDVPKENWSFGNGIAQYA